MDPSADGAAIPVQGRRGLLSWWGVRHNQAVIMFLCTAMAYSLRVNLNLVIVAMKGQGVAKVPNIPVFDWSDVMEDWIVSSFYFGYLMLQIPAGHLAQRSSARLFLAGSMLATSLCTLLLPVAAIYGDWPGVMAARIATGLCQCFIFPSCYVLLGRWAPPLERGRIVSFVMGAMVLGPAIMMPVSGQLAGSAGGWPSVFYVSGGAGVLLAVVVYMFIADSPAEHPRISEEEREYVERAIIGRARGQQLSTRTTPTPWRSIVTSVPLWATILAHAGQAWGYITIISQVPSYLTRVHKFNIKENGGLNALPYIITWLASFGFSGLSDFITSRKLLPLTASRKIFNTIGMWGPGLALVGVGYMGDSPTLAVTMLTLAMGLKAACYVGFQVNYVDLTPQFSGTAFSLGNFVAVLAASQSGRAASALVPDKASAEQWRYVFFISAALFFLGGTIFLLLGSAKLQPWNGNSRASMYLSKDSIAAQGLERLRARAAAENNNS